MSILNFGWSDFWKELNFNENNLARITAVHRSLLKAITIHGEINVYFSGGFQSEMESGGPAPATGDWIAISPPFTDQNDKPAAIIQSLLPRRTKISRLSSGGSEQVLAANIDYAFIVTSVNNDYSVNRIQRYVLLAQEGKVEPIVVLSKCDLVTESILELRKNELIKSFPNLKVILISSQTGIGVEEVHSLLLPKTTSVFIGSSGVGKSTLVNTLLERQVQKTLMVRQGDDKGRHTTTSRELFFISEGGMIIDTPGLREVQVLGDQEALDKTFESIPEFLGHCRFSDCTHNNEPGCAIVAALENGDLSMNEWENYQKLQRELEFAQRKIDKQSQSNAKRRWKQVNKDMRKRRKLEDNN